MSKDPFKWLNDPEEVMALVDLTVPRTRGICALISVEERSTLMPDNDDLTIYWCEHCWHARLLGAITAEEFRETMSNAQCRTGTWRCTLCSGRVTRYDLGYTPERRRTVPPVVPLDNPDQMTLLMP
jgi:hypothetical protein